MDRDAVGARLPARPQSESGGRAVDCDAVRVFCSLHVLFHVRSQSPEAELWIVMR